MEHIWILLTPLLHRPSDNETEKDDEDESGLGRGEKKKGGSRPPSSASPGSRRTQPAIGGRLLIDPSKFRNHHDDGDNCGNVGRQQRARTRAQVLIMATMH